MALEASAPSGVAVRAKTTRVVSSHISVPRRVVEIWLSRQLLVNLVRTEIRVKYKNSFLGLVWSFLAPAMTLTVFALVFGVALKNGYPDFVILLFSGLLAWNLFQTAILAATGVIVNNAGLVKKVSFPREILALASVGSASVFFFFQACVMVIFLAVLHIRPAFSLLWLIPVAFVPLIVFCSAMAIFLSAVNVYLRDVQHLVEVVVGSVWFWACPIVYSFQKIVYPKLNTHYHILWIYFLNPMTPIVMTFERVLYAKTGFVPLTIPGHPKFQLLPGWGPMTYVELDAMVLGVSLLLLYGAMIVFGRLAGNFAEELYVAPVAVEIQDVSKRFRLYHQKYTSLKERVIHAGRTPYTDLWALRDIGFQVNEGQTVGILGRNGSGKSTLLKCVCGVLQPTEGQVVVRGKLAGLLELGAGFQPDLTGRQNIYLNGSLLGMAKSDIDKIFEEIVAFAELDQFIDNQVKFYSSGMYVRLGFAVAVNVDPDVLVIDEVLAVGDERFQRKCLDRVKQFQDEGRTIILVSHSPDQVRAICDEAVVLSDGRMVGHGTPGEAVRIFREHLLEAGDILSLGHGEEEAPTEAAPIVVAETTDRLHPIRITEVISEHPATADQAYVVTGDPLIIRLRYTSAEPTTTASFVVEMHDDSGKILLRTVSGDLGMEFDIPSGRGTVAFRYESFPFSDGVYDVSAGVEHRAGGELYDWKESAVRVEVMNPTKTVGLVNLPVGVTLETTTAGGYSVPA